MMTLVVPWRKAGEQTWSTYFYQVPVTDLTQISSNYSYTVNLNVGMLGSLVPETPEELDELSYQIVDWSSERIDVNITDSRYLVVSPKNFEVNNESEITIPVFSSHSVVVTDITMTYNRFNYYSDGNGDVVEFTVTKEQIDASNKKATGTKLCTYPEGTLTANAQRQLELTVSHPLTVWIPYDKDGQEVSLTLRNKNNSDNSPETVNKTIAYYQESSSKEAAYSSYTIKVTLQHQDNPAYTEEITIVQYPGMYIHADRNPGGRYSAAISTLGFITISESNYGFVFVNPEWVRGTLRGSGWLNSSDLGGVHGLGSSSSSNKNPNMYVISVSVLQDGSKYVIGDPRMLYTNNSLDGSSNLTTSTSNANEDTSWSVEADALYDGTSKRRLKYYYPTIEGENSKMMIAPKIRVASSYGVSNSSNRTNMRRRVASYQEQGCLAGRWRLPTYGELLFITTLSNEGKIPKLFDGTYLTAQGPYKVDPDEKTVEESSDTEYSVRGIYDEWYWEAQDNYVLQPNSSGGYDFTWGDVPRNATRSAELINMYKSRIVK
ncbi:MAG: hypothetical protein K2F94_06880 [Muribaculaceae bacterium]|nr:hypothetical protein [Muribaculaceae bacterium]